MSKDLLIISCSSRKNKFRSKRPAWDVYDGVIFRVLKKNNIDFNKFDVVILSAKHGLISPGTLISHYDLKMTNKRAIELKSEVSKSLKKVFRKGYKRIYSSLGKIYLTGIEKDISDKFIQLEGGIGIKMKKLKKIISY